MEIGQIDTPYGKAKIVLGRYQSSGAVCVQLIEEDGQSLAVFSVNLTQYGVQLAGDEFNIKTWSENSALVGPMLSSGLFEDTGRTFKTDYVESPIWRLKGMPVLPVYVI